MARRRLLWQLYLNFLLVTTLSLIAALLFASWALREFYFSRIKTDLEARAVLVKKQVRRPLLRSEEDLDSLCDDLGKSSNTRITLILPSGKVTADSDEDPSLMDNHADRPEIKTAFSGKIGTEIRYSYTLKKKMVYVAIPIRERGRIVGAVRTSMPMASVGQALRGVQGRILLGVLVIALVAMAVSLAVSKKISSPLEEMRLGAQRFARGDFESRLMVSNSEEMGGLAEAMNEMVSQLDERICAITQQRNEQEAILASMTEGVIAVNSEDRIISVNEAACRMLGMEASNVSGRSIQEVIRNASLHKLVSRTLSEQRELQEDITLEAQETRFLQAHSAVLRDAAGRSIGAVLVLNDVTQLRRLENMRKEFVSNVSHELRTPITSIKGFVETLQDGALQSPEDTERFLGIIAKQVDQLNAIIEDLLLLSRIEQNDEKNGISLQEGRIRDVLESAIEVCGSKAVKKDISIGLQCDTGLTATINIPLLTQAVVNLLDNAINFSEVGGSVQVRATEEEKHICVSVQDEGCGIPQEHLPRLFERFYRVDKARSRKLGGTGLGLAIVKHITQAHGGTLTVTSFHGKGSTFSIHFPA